jgi:hypothetical protein
VDLGELADPAFLPQHIPITEGAYSKENERDLAGYLAYCQRKVKDAKIRSLLRFAALCILEEISFTRKDGQYLRWDHRSWKGANGRKFDKGRIPTFREAISRQLGTMVADMNGGGSLFVKDSARRGTLELRKGSCLEILPTLADKSFDFVLTSPPYCNRYDYTRTYALELVFLGCSAEEAKRYRQALLSCTVENRAKTVWFQQFYDNLSRPDVFRDVTRVFQKQPALTEVVGVLEDYGRAGSLNNANITRMVRNYFYEMGFVIYELGRLLRPGGVVAMVNDNVRYAGEEVPVDLILSDFAESFGFRTRQIWTLGRGKGNSSQQMGNHGRTELRKCVYVWEKL